MHHLNPTQFLPGWLARLPTMTSFSRTLAWMKRATRVDIPFIRSVACARLASVADPDHAHELLLVHGLISQHALGNVGHVVARRQKIRENHLQCAPIQRMDARFSVHGAHVRGCRFFRSVETRPPRPVERLVASGHRWRNTREWMCVAVAREARELALLSCGSCSELSVRQCLSPRSIICPHFEMHYKNFRESKQNFFRETATLHAGPLQCRGARGGSSGE